MNLSVQDAIKSGIIMNVNDIKLSNDAKKVFKEGIIYDALEESIDDQNFVTTEALINDLEDGLHKVAHVNSADHSKTVQREIYSDYVYPPLKRSFRACVRIIALVLRASVKFKKLLIIRKVKRGLADKSDLQKLNFPPVKFTTFTLITGDITQNQEK